MTGERYGLLGSPSMQFLAEPKQWKEALWVDGEVSDGWTDGRLDGDGVNGDMRMIGMTVSWPV